MPDHEPHTDSVASHAATWISSIIDANPRRVAGSQSERAAHDMMRQDLIEAGVPDVTLAPFRHNRSLYANMALHFLLAVIGSVLLVLGISPFIALGLHLFVVVSYWLESNKTARVLRHAFPWHDSQNLIGTSACDEPTSPRKRIVIASHIDAAFTGILFHPKVLKQALKPPPFEFLMFLRKSMLVSTGSVLLLAALDVLALFMFAETLWFHVLVGALTVPALLTVLLNGQVVLKNTVVPGANDNLTGCFAVLEMARRLLPDKPGDVELVFVAMGCEEAGTGGSWALCEQRLEQWPAQETIVIGVDTLSGGTLHYFEEGEFFPIPVPGELESLVHELLPDVPKYPIPSGATDALPFLVRGYKAMTFGCVDTDIGAPRHYHYPTDDVAHLDLVQLEQSLDSIELYLRELMTRD